MSDFNHEILETMDIVPCFIPVDMQTAANTGAWVNVSLAQKILCVLFKATGTVGDDPIFKLQQGLTSSGGTPKDILFTRVRSKIGAIATTGIWTLTTQAAATSVTLTSAANPAVIAVEIQASDLDVNNGYKYLNLSIADTGSNAQLGCAFYLLQGLKYQQSILPSNIL